MTYYRHLAPNVLEVANMPLYFERTTFANGHVYTSVFIDKHKRDRFAGAIEGMMNSFPVIERPKVELWEEVVPKSVWQEAMNKADLGSAGCPVENLELYPIHKNKSGMGSHVDSLGAA